MTYHLGLHVFRRDLRTEDNTALSEACERCEQVIACFILDPRQRDHPYFSANAFDFMLNSLIDLNEQLHKHKGRLILLEGEAEEVVERLIGEQGVEAVFCNRDYTPFSRERDTRIARLCERRGVAFHTRDDLLLNPPESVLTGKGTPYTVFTPYYRAASERPIPRPAKLARASFVSLPVPGEVSLAQVRERTPRNPRLGARPGRAVAVRILKGLQRYEAYSELRDLPAADATTRLSAHNKFGTVSVREAYWAMVDALGHAHPLVRQLFWRDFFTQIAHHHPRIFGHAFQKGTEKVQWSRSERAFAAWCEGRTGFPLIDAGMRELRETGYMHNRVRMVAASFLTKDLHIDWRWGERHFARYLVDYDPCVNNGSWQWAASTGCDAQPYFRIFNPWLQSRRFDPDGKYSKRWVGELEGVDAKRLHRLDREAPPEGYPAPIVDHQREKKEAIARFADAKA